MILLVSGAESNRGTLSVRGSPPTPRNGNSIARLADGGRMWACDNDAFKSWNINRFWTMLGKVSRADRTSLLFVTVPDSVGNARETLNLWFEWYPQLAYLTLPAAFVGQDGIEHFQKEIPWQEMACWFVGGSTGWKLSAVSEELAREAKARGKWVHFGRANSKKRFRHAFEIGADSVDGGQFSTWPDHWIPRGSNGFNMRTGTRRCSEREDT